jgi:D-alanine--poly(phosphoribitol) ligase subunit 1
LAGAQHNIGLIYARTVFSYAAVVAIMRSNCVYVPLNTKAPAQRLLKVIEDADIHAVIVDAGDGLSAGVAEMLKRCRGLDVITPEGDLHPSLDLCMPGDRGHKRWQVAKAEVVSDGEILRGADSPASTPRLAYIIYTSGSTGVPKGVAIKHDGARRCIEKFHGLFGTGHEDRFTQFSALSFDTSIMEMFVCWKSGGALYVPPSSELLVPLNYVVTHGITVWSSVPSLATFLLKLGLLKDNALPCVRWSLFGGDAFPAELARAWSAAAPRSRIFNLYGPNEVTITSTYYEYNSESPTSGLIPIGAPMPQLHCMIVDDGQVIEAEDVPGELWIAGDQLALGYWNNRAATEAAFVRFPQGDPRAPLWYRTGDLVSWRQSTGLSFRGRLDRQVKLRGYRIELQEIESALRNVIGCALVAAIPIRSSSGVCEKIIAYCDKLAEDEATTRSRCFRSLPRYMVPDHIYELDPFPLSDHGKIDYRALTARAGAL